MTEAPKVALIGAVIGVLGTLVIAFLTVLTKGYNIPILAERRSTRKLKANAFKKYAHPIILAFSALLYRLDEILSYRIKYLLQDAPQTQFNRYKYISTIYRLCSLMEWMRASNIEYSNIEVKSDKDYRKIRDIIDNFDSLWRMDNK